MIRRIALSFLVVTLVVVTALGVPLGIVTARLHLERLTAATKQDALEVAGLAAAGILAGRAADLPLLAAEYRRQTGGDGRLTIVDATGKSMADSDPTAMLGEDFANRPEVAAALSGRTDEGHRYSYTMVQSVAFTSVPIQDMDGTVLGAVRVTHPASFGHRQILITSLTVGALSLLVLSMVWVLGRWIAEAVTRPLRAVERAAEHLGSGDLAARASLPGTAPKEVALLARSFNTMAEELNRLVAAHQRFTADAAHQLRTPLAVLRLRLELLQDSVSGSGMEDLVVAQREAVRLSSLVDGLLKLAAAERGGLDRTTVNIAEVAGDRIEAWGPLADEHDLRLRSEMIGAPLALARDGHLEQVLDNLLANAFDVSEPGSTIEIRGESEGDGWIGLHVIDEGPGLPPELRTAAFDRFWSRSLADPSRRQASDRADRQGERLGGSGLGLAIVAALVSADGGHISLRGAGRGTGEHGGIDVYIRLPAATDTAQVGPRSNTMAIAGGRRGAPDTVGATP